jgi:hypothetical protein
MQKNILLIIVWILLTIGFFKFMMWNYLQYHGADMWIELSETYTTIANRFEIGKQLSKFQICDTYIKYWCLKWELKWFKMIDDYEALVYFKIDESSIEKNSFWTWYVYNLFWQYDQRFLFEKEDLPKFWWIIWTEMALYSENTFKYLISKGSTSMLDKKIIQFKELEKNPKIVINWINYTK